MLAFFYLFFYTLGLGLVLTGVLVAFSFVAVQTTMQVVLLQLTLPLVFWGLGGVFHKSYDGMITVCKTSMTIVFVGLLNYGRYYLQQILKLKGLLKLRARRWLI